MAAVVEADPVGREPRADGPRVDDGVGERAERDGVLAARRERSLCAHDRPNERGRVRRRGLRHLPLGGEIAERVARQRADGDERPRNRERRDRFEDRSRYREVTVPPGAQIHAVSEAVRVEVCRRQPTSAVGEQVERVEVGSVLGDRREPLALEVGDVRRQFDGVNAELGGESVDEPPDVLVATAVSPPENEQAVAVGPVVEDADLHGRACGGDVKSPCERSAHGRAFEQRAVRRRCGDESASNRPHFPIVVRPARPATRRVAGSPRGGSSGRPPRPGASSSVGPTRHRRAPARR